MLLYADEDFPFPAVEELRRLGHDVLTAQEDGRTSIPDRELLARAHALGRAVLTYNRRHYERLHRKGAAQRHPLGGSGSGPPGLSRPYPCGLGRVISRPLVPAHQPSAFALIPGEETGLPGIPLLHRHRAAGLMARAEAQGVTYMKTYEFDVVLKDVSELPDDQAARLFAAGCDDGTPASCEGVAWIHFDREAASLEEAILSAVVQVQAAGFLVSKVELDVHAAAVSLGA
jgi:hypothetical protein